MARILYANVHDRHYPRNHRVRTFLSDQGHEVVTDDRDGAYGLVRGSARIIYSGVRRRGPFDVVILSELGLKFAPAAWIVAKRHRARLVSDAFIGLYESNVEDRSRTSPGSVRARLYRAFDRWAARTSAVCLTDTVVRRDRIIRDGARRVVVLPVGAPSWAHFMPRHATSDCVHVLYYGNYIPLHGLPYVVKAIAALQEPQRFRFTFVGEGPARPDIERAARRAGVFDLISWQDYVPPHELARLIADSDVVLGVFGTSPKAATVLANKVWQGLSAGRYVVTRESEALDEILPLIEHTQLRVVDPYATESLTKVLDELASSVTSNPQSSVFPDSEKALEGYVESMYDDLNVALTEITSQ